MGEVISVISLRVYPSDIFAGPGKRANRAGALRSRRVTSDVFLKFDFLTKPRLVFGFWVSGFRLVSRSTRESYN